MRKDGLLRRRADREAVVLDRHLAFLGLPVSESGRRRSLREVVDVTGDHVARPGLVQPARALRDCLVLHVSDLDVADVVELLQVRDRLVDERRILGVDIGVSLAEERHGDGLSRLGEERCLALVRLGLPEDVPRLLHRRDVFGDVIGPPGDARRVAGVGHGVV